MLAVGMASAANRTVTTEKVPTSAAEPAALDRRRATTTATARNTNAAKGHAQRSVCTWNFPNTVSGDRAAVTTPISTPAAAMASAATETRSRWRRATHAHAPNTTAST